MDPDTMSFLVRYHRKSDVAERVPDDQKRLEFIKPDLQASSIGIPKSLYVIASRKCDRAIIDSSSAPGFFVVTEVLVTKSYSFAPHFFAVGTLSVVVHKRHRHIREHVSKTMSEGFQHMHPDERDNSNNNDCDSAIGSLGESSTETLSSWICQYRKEHGRTYHAFDPEKYWGPNDRKAQDHLDLAHHLFTLTFNGKLFVAPISPDLSNVLDIGTGTGIWAIDFADMYPSAVVIGTDLSPIQPTWVPPNVKFEIDDCEQDWTYSNEHFDYIHIRGLNGCIKDWHKLYAQALRCLKPGGYIEHTEYAPESEEQGQSNNRYNFGKPVIEAGERMRRTAKVMYGMCNWIFDAGFQDVVEKRYQWPLGPWPKDPKLKELGVWARAHADAGLEEWGLAPLTGVLGWSYEEAQVHIAKSREVLWDRKRHLWHEMRVVYGRKPK